LTLRVGNFFADLPDSSEQERFLTLFENETIRIERIVSHSHSSPAGFWYDQPQSEWVIILRGQGVLEFEDGEMIPLHEGDHLLIPSHFKHRVQQTGPDTLWLAVHIKES
jgi:cupin 2 domain-containing protein